MANACSLTNPIGLLSFNLSFTAYKIATIAAVESFS
jgi:hypothetical protein